MPQQFARPSHTPSIGNIERVDRIGRFGTLPNQPERTGQLAGGNRAAWARVLRNPSFAGRSRAGVAIFRGHFADHGDFADRGWRRRHHLRPFVIGWAGPLFWPYAYDDFVDYTFYPHAYDTFWPYAYDDVYQSMFTPSARGGGATAANLCAGPIAGLTDPAIARIAQAIEPDDAQRALLDAFKGAAADALDQLKASCPNALPSTPTGRLAAMHQRLDAMLQAVRAVRPTRSVLPVPQRRAEGAFQRAQRRHRGPTGPARPFASVRGARVGYCGPADRTG
jgi:hypothetical protein